MRSGPGDASTLRHSIQLLCKAYTGNTSLTKTTSIHIYYSHIRKDTRDDLALLLDEVKSVHERLPLSTAVITHD
jgi:hypothetical protein